MVLELQFESKRVVGGDWSFDHNSCVAVFSKAAQLTKKEVLDIEKGQVP